MLISCAYLRRTDHINMARSSLSKSQYLDIYHRIGVLSIALTSPTQVLDFYSWLLIVHNEMYGVTVHLLVDVMIHHQVSSKHE